MTVLGADVDFPVCLAVSLPDFVNGAPAIGSAPAVRRYGDGRAGQLARVEVVVEEVEHGLGLGYDLGNIQHALLKQISQLTDGEYNEYYEDCRIRHDGGDGSGSFGLPYEMHTGCC